MNHCLSLLRKLLLRWDVWALFLVIAMGGLVGAEFFATMQQSQQLAKPDIGDNSWQTYQLDLELYRLDKALEDFMHGNRDVDTIQMRLDILASRLEPANQQGSVQSTPAALQALNTLSTNIDRWGRVVAQLRGDQPQALSSAGRLRQEVSQQEQSVQALILAVHEEQTLRVDTVRQHLHQRFARLTISFGLLGLGVTLFVAILLVRSSRERRLTQKLSHLNEHLESKVTERTQALAEQSEMLNMILEASPVGVALLDEPSHQLVFANSHWSTSLGFAAEPQDSRPLPSLFAHSAEEQAFWQRLGEQGTVHNHEAALRSTRGEMIGVISAKRFPYAGTHKQLLWIYDISERKQLENRLRELATYDALTGAVNRATFLEALDQAIHLARQNSRPLSLISLDLDHFKRINDTYGHPVGDQALRQFAQLTQATLRKQDVFGRLGGEEFCILLAEASQVDAESLAERIRMVIAATAIELGACERLRFTISIGIAVWQVEESSDTLLTRVDHALYQAKNSGRNRIAIASTTG